MAFLGLEEVQAIGESLFEAEKSGRSIRLISTANPDMDMEDAYAIQKSLVNKKLADGRIIKGYKIGLTSRAMQKALGIDVPDSGVLFDNMFFDNCAKVPRGRFIEPRIEAEIAFFMKRNLKGANICSEEVSDATEYVAPALEILDEVEKKINKPVFSSNQTLIWDTIRSAGYKNSITGYGQLLRI